MLEPRSREAAEQRRTARPIQGPADADDESTVDDYKQNAASFDDRHFAGRYLADRSNSGRSDTDRFDPGRFDPGRAFAAATARCTLVRCAHFESPGRSVAVRGASKMALVCRVSRRTVDCLACRVGEQARPSFGTETAAACRLGLGGTGSSSANSGTTAQASRSLVRAAYRGSANLGQGSLHDSGSHSSIGACDARRRG